MIDVRTARADELVAVGALTAAAYLADGCLEDTEDGYVLELRDAEGRAAAADVLVAVDDDGLVGTATYCPPGSAFAELAGDREAELRMLAVAPAARGRGVGAALVRVCVDRARTQGCTALVLSTMPVMAAAASIYRRLGFVRDPGRDWSPVAGVDLLAYTLALAPYCDQCGRPVDEGPAAHRGCAERRELEPPRWCPLCRRRMVVQVTPRGWSARCAEHGLRGSP